MANGMALMFGIRFHENFERPYASRSITEFWRRWHISLSSWFRDYVYIPLGGSRGSSLATYRNLLLVFAITGLWHGAAWTFLVWGMFHGAFLIIERMTFRSPIDALRHSALRWFYCLPLVIFAWVVFRASTLNQAFGMWGIMLSPLSWQPFDVVVARAALAPYSIAAFAVGSLIFVVPGRVSLGFRLMSGSMFPPLQLADFAYTAAALIVSGLLILTGSFSPFLYFAF